MVAPQRLQTLTVSLNPPPVPQVLYSDSFRKQVQGKAAFVLDTPEMRRVRETQRIISGVRFWLPLLEYSVFTFGDLFTFMSFVFTLIIFIICCCLDFCRQRFPVIRWRFINSVSTSWSSHLLSR